MNSKTHKSWNIKGATCKKSRFSQKKKKETKSLIRSSSKYDSLGFILGLRVRLKNKLLPLNFNSEETFYLLSVEELLIRSNLLALHNREWMNFEF